MNLDLNAIAQSAYNAITEIQTAATELVGLECLWARAVPVMDSADVILQEYTLHNVEEPRTISIINQNNDYNPGNLSIDLFGVEYEQPLEVNITLTEWNKIYSSDTMPQKGDIVYIKIYHKLFQVTSSSQVFSVGANPMYYKCQLKKYVPSADRKENDAFKESREELTVSQEILFGDLISQEVADNNNTVETGYNNTTFVDPVKSFDIDSIVSNQIYGSDMNIISNAYYDFKIAKQNLVYNENLIYETSAERNHLIYTCWFKNDNVQIETGKVIKLTYFSKDRSYWNFIIGSTLKLNVGDTVTITRGTLLKITGEIVLLPCDDSIGIRFKTPDITKANRKLTGWYDNTSSLKIYKSVTYNLLSGYDNNDKTVMNISYTQSEVIFNINDINKTAQVTLQNDIWHYIMLDISPNNIHYIITDLKESQNNSYIDKIVYDKNIKIELEDFNVNQFTIENKEKDICMCNIRLYENEYPMCDEYNYDMYSPVVRNASKLIFVDTPNVPNKSMFVSPIR